MNAYQMFGIIVLAGLIVTVIGTIGQFIISEWQNIESGMYDDDYDDDLYIRRK